MGLLYKEIKVTKVQDNTKEFVIFVLAQQDTVRNHCAGEYGVVIVSCCFCEEVSGAFLCLNPPCALKAQKTRNNQQKTLYTYLRTTI